MNNCNVITDSLPMQIDVLSFEKFISDVDKWHEVTAQLGDTWKSMDPHKDLVQTHRWREYRLKDCFEICTQEAERIKDLLHAVPRSALESRTSLAELEQQFGLWKPYLSDGSDDSDYVEESEEDDLGWEYRPGDEDFPLKYNDSDDDIEEI